MAHIRHITYGQKDKSTHGRTPSSRAHTSRPRIHCMAYSNRAVTQSTHIIYITKYVSPPIRIVPSPQQPLSHLEFLLCPFQIIDSLFV